MRRDPDGVRGILAGVGGLGGWLDIAVVALTVASGARYVSGHGLADRAPAVLAGTVVLLVVYAAPRRRATRKPATRAAAWCAVLLTTWLVLVVLAPSFAWLAVPLSFVALRVLPFAAAGAVVAGMTVAVVVAWTLMQGRLDPTIVAGPACVAGLAVIAYRTLEREAAARLQLLGALQEAQGDLVDAQHSAGVLAERTRLSREIHDSVAQGFSSINLLLQAAEQAWDDRPDAAREHMAQAAGAAREGLEDVRRVVRDLAPAEIMSGGTGPALTTALRSTCERGVRGSHVSVSVRVDGRPVDVPADVATAVLRTVRGALANVVEHASATTAVVSLTYQPDALHLDVRDDGRGFDPRYRAERDGRGRGLSGIRHRAEQFGGSVAVETAPGEGTTVAFSIPLESCDGRP